MITVLSEAWQPFYKYFTSAYYREFSRLYTLYGRSPRFQEKSVKFLKYRCQIPDAPSFVWQFKDIFVDQVYKFGTESENPVIYDCGANIGMSCLYFKFLYPKAQIKAFEADPQICLVLEENLQRNNLNDIQVIKKAVWNKEDLVNFSRDGADGGSLLGESNLTQISVIRLKDWIAKEERIDMLKLDIEGTETEVIVDCDGALKHVRHLFVEYHSWNNRPQTLGLILNILERNKFRYYLETAGGIRKIPFVNKNRTSSMDVQINIFAYQQI